MVPICLIAMKTTGCKHAYLHSFIAARVGRAHWNRKRSKTARRRREGEGGEVTGSRERKQNGRGCQQWMTTSTCPNRRLPPPSDAPMLWGREEKRDAERGTQKSNDRSLLVYLFLPPPTSTQSTIRRVITMGNMPCCLFTYSMSCFVLFFYHLYSVTYRYSYRKYKSSIKEKNTLYRIEFIQSECDMFKTLTWKLIFF